jgi:AcrR family transcriptional regulator
MKKTEQRILDAAMRVFGRDGVSGATTREIARVARVNEVTLFRHFRNKNELLRQMVLCSAKQYDLVFASASVKSRADFRKTVRSFANAYQQKLRTHEDLVRTFIGELKRHLKLSRRLFVEGSKGSRLRFIDYLKSAQKAGLIRKDIDPVAATDAFGGMMMTGVLRRPLTESYYSLDHYFDTCVDLFLKGIER